MGILQDYKNRTVKDVRNLQWDNEEKTSFTALVVFAELERSLGEIAFSTGPGADTRHGVEIWEKGISGDYGKISEFSPPEVSQIEAWKINAAFFSKGLDPENTLPPREKALWRTAGSIELGGQLLKDVFSAMGLSKKAASEICKLAREFE